MLAVSRFVLCHKLAVVVFWLAVLVAGAAAAAKLSSRLSAQFALPGAASYQANQQILRLYGTAVAATPRSRWSPCRQAVRRSALGAAGRSGGRSAR